MTLEQLIRETVGMPDEDAILMVTDSGAIYAFSEIQKSHSVYFADPPRWREYDASIHWFVGQGCKKENDTDVKVLRLKIPRAISMLEAMLDKPDPLKEAVRELNNAGSHIDSHQEIGNDLNLRYAIENLRNALGIVIDYLSKESDESK